MTLAEAFNGSRSATWATETSLTTDTAGPDSQTDDGLYAPWLDLSALARGDHYRLRAYEMVVGGGTQRKVAEWNLMNQQTAGLTTIPPLMMLHGWDFTLQRIAGTDRAITWSVKAATGGITEFDSGTDTIGTSEYFLVSDSTTKTKQTTAGFYQLWLDLTTVVKGDEFVLRCYEEARSADSTDQPAWVRLLRFGEPIRVYETVHLANGWEYSLDRILAADRSVPWSVRKSG